MGRILETLRELRDRSTLRNVMTSDIVAGELGSVGAIFKVLFLVYFTEVKSKNSTAM